MNQKLSLISIAFVTALIAGTSSSTTNAAESSVSQAPLIPIDQFLKRDSFGTIKISPTGEYFAATVPLEDRTSLVILRRSDLQKIGNVTFESKVHVIDFNWVNPKRILFSIGQSGGDLAAPQPTGEIYGVDFDGKNQDGALVGIRARASTNVIANKGTKFVGASLLDTMRAVDDEVLIAVGGPEGSFGQADKMNVNTGARKIAVRAPVLRAGYAVDNNSVIRFAAGAGSDNKVRTYYRTGENAKWQQINDELQTETIVQPIGFSTDNSTAYLDVEEKEGPNAIYSFDPKTQQKKLLYKDDFVNAAYPLRNPLNGGVYGFVLEDGKYRVEYLDKADPFGKTLRSIQANFSDEFVSPTSYTADGKLGVYVVESDKFIGDFYLFDSEKKQFTWLASRGSWLKPETMAERRPIIFTSRDGTQIEGIVTFPKGKSEKNLPLVVHPHGGPIGPYDSWGYDGQSQILANRGYAVLQLNFRGSGNYGRKFMRAGYKQWGEGMINDITDATKSLINQGTVDAKRICIFGSSYGGYASLMSVAKEPDLYRCAIGNVGVYDLKMLYGRGDVQERKSGENYLKEAVGEVDLDTVSPNKLASRIKAPVLLMAGREDARAPWQHSEVMHKALVAAGKTSELKIYEKEGHGNYLPENRLDYQNRIVNFLDKHIGPAR
jgi:dipeptidyl aminopeptidase/acylaminoacyl peptidase